MYRLAYGAAHKGLLISLRDLSLVCIVYKCGTQFRIWATNVLKDHLIKGYTINEKRMRPGSREQIS